MRIVSAGIPDYDTAVPAAHFCLHTEGNGWGARVVDYMAMECLPLMVNDGMVRADEGASSAPPDASRACPCVPTRRTRSPLRALACVCSPPARAPA